MLTRLNSWARRHRGYRKRQSATPGWPSQLALVVPAAAATTMISKQGSTASDDSHPSFLCHESTLYFDTAACLFDVLLPIFEHQTMKSYSHYSAG